MMGPLCTGTFVFYSAAFIVLRKARFEILKFQLLSQENWESGRTKQLLLLFRIEIFGCQDL